MRVLKFGGSSLGSIEGFQNVLNIINQSKNDGPIVIVVSALGGITNGLLELIEDSMQQNDCFEHKLEQIKTKHQYYSTTFVAKKYQQKCAAFLNSKIDTLIRLLTGIQLLDECTPRARDAILSFGEKCSQQLLYFALLSNGHKVLAPQAEHLIQTNSHFGSARVNRLKSDECIKHVLANLKNNQIAVVAGFLGADKNGHTTTLGRDGSDYTAGLIGAALKAKTVEIWSDVDGILDSDPQIIAEAQLISNLHYLEAAEIAFFGAEVLHPKTIRPLKQAAIPILINNTFKPGIPGTIISEEIYDTGIVTKVITAKQDITLFKVAVKKARQSSIIISRFFELLDHLEIRTFMVNQNSADASFSIAVREKYAEDFQKYLEDTFSDGFSENYIEQLEKHNGYSIVSAIGYNITSDPYTTAGFFEALQTEQISSVNISFGVTGHNISALINNLQTDRAVKRLHHILIQNPLQKSLKLAVNQ